MRIKRLLWLIPVLWLTGCSGGFGNASEIKPKVAAVEEMPDYTVKTVTLSNLQETVSVYFNYSASGDKAYSFEKDSVLEQVYYKNGDSVIAGDILACVKGYEQAAADHENYTGIIKKKKEQLEKLTKARDYEKNVLNVKRKYSAISKEEYEAEKRVIAAEYDDDISSLEDDIEIAELKLAEADKIYDGGALFAASSGTVTYARSILKSNKNWGNWGNWSADDNKKEDDEEDAEEESIEKNINYVKKGEEVIRISAGTEAAFICNTEYASRFKVGQTITLSSGSQNYECIVSEVTDSTVKAIPNLVDSSIRMGLQINYKLVLSEKEAVNTIPSSCLHVSGDQYYVYILGEDNIRRMKFVEIGIRSNDSVEIVSGLETGDIVVGKAK